MDLHATSQPITREFLAVILSGFGNELWPLTSDHGDQPCPKALLPVANKPMLDYTLSWIEKSGIQDVLLICPTSHRTAISHHIHSNVVSAVLRIDLQTYDESPDSSVGTCKLLRHFSHRIQEDFVLLPCDFIAPPSLPLTTLLSKFRSESTSDGSIATACWFIGHRLEKGTIPDEWGPAAPHVPIVWDERTGTLLHVATPDEVDHNADELELRMGLLSCYPRATLSANYEDSHVYVCRKSILDTLQEKSLLESFREEFLPWLCKVQYQRAKREKYGHVLNPITNTALQSMALRHSTLHAGLPERRNSAFSTTPSSSLRHAKHLTMSVPTSPTGSDIDHVLSASLRVGVILHRANNGFAARANTIHSFLELNRRFLDDASYSLPTDPKNRALIDQKAQISTDSIVGDSTRIEERTTIKKSVIGRHCVIGKMTKVAGCVILDHCVIGDGAKLEGCILGKNTKVGSKAELIKCVTQAGYDIGAGESYKHEKLEISDWMAASEEELSVSENGSMDGDERGCDSKDGQ